MYACVGLVGEGMILEKGNRETSQREPVAGNQVANDDSTKVAAGLQSYCA